MCDEDCDDDCCDGGDFEFEDGFTAQEWIWEHGYTKGYASPRPHIYIHECFDTCPCQGRSRHKEFVQLERQLRPLLSVDVTDVAKQFFLRMVTIYRFQGALHLRDKECQQLSKLQNRGTSKGWKRNRE